MAHEAIILLDSISERGHRLTTFELVFPRIILAEWNTHRVFSRNSASSRAIPVAKMIKMVMEDPYIPMTWGKNQKGMQAAEEILGEDALTCRSEWLHARDHAVHKAQMLMDIGVHKQLTNRLLEPFMWHTVINSSTEYSNFFGLRNDKHAHPDIQKVAGMMQEIYWMNEPELLKIGQWHTPYAQDNENLGNVALQITSGRCARVSYLTHDGQRDAADDIRVHDTMLSNGHMSPLEHAARPMDNVEYNELFRQPQLEWDRINGRFVQKCDEKTGPLWNHFCGNFNGWVSYRKTIPHEEDYGTYLKSLQNS